MKKFLRKAFKITKPSGATWVEWGQWRLATKTAHPIGWFFTETLPVIFSEITRPIWKIQYWAKYNIFDKRNIVKTKLKSGYWDARERILFANFSILVDFVEIDKASRNHEFLDSHVKNWRWFHVFRRRIPQAGIDYLLWETTLDDPSLGSLTSSPLQAQKAREVLELYYWWKIQRPNRLDPHESSGWSRWCNIQDTNGNNVLNFNTSSFEQHLLAKSMHIEDYYDREDDENLIRLMNIRQGLWV